MLKLVVLIFLFGAGGVVAQPPDHVDRLSSESDLDRMSVGMRLNYGMIAADYLSSDEVTASDREIFAQAEDARYTQNLYFAATIDDCQRYRQRVERGLPMPRGFFVSSIAQRDRLHYEERDAWYEDLFAQLSPVSQELVIDTIEASRGTNLFSRSTTNWVSYYAQNPDRAEETFIKGCDSLPERMARQEQREKGITGGLIPDGIECNWEGSGIEDALDNPCFNFEEIRHLLPDDFELPHEMQQQLKLWEGNQ